MRFATTISFLVAWCIFAIVQGQQGVEYDHSRDWWKETSIYQIYPRSYMDSDGDGIGDLAGIIGQLDYIKKLGFETIWISPFFQSPQGDFGYDISDYFAIDPPYGDLAMADSLITEVHSRGMKIVFDLVLNHTSIDHEWFRTSMQSRDNDKSDYYIWRDGNGHKPPNNWNNVFNKKSWYYIEERDQYYYTAFLEFQPDLNWRNPEVKAAMFNMVKFWLDKGVDGFRLDIFNCIMEDPSFKNNPFVFKMLPSRDGMKAKFQKKINNINHPDNFELARQLRDTIDRYSQPDRFLVGEAIGPLKEIHPLVGEQGDGLNLIFLFDMIFFEYNAKFFRKKIQEFEELFPAPLMPTIVYGNHDNFRRSRRIGEDLEKDRLLTLFQTTARGIPVIYYGEEIGMTNPKISKKKAKDPISRVFKGLPQFMRNWLPVPVNRDVCRTPMQWTSAPNAGFCPEDAKPWLPVNKDLTERNVEVMADQPLSLLNTYRDLLAIRSDERTIHKGRIQLLQSDDIPKNVLVYSRAYENEQLIVILNFSKSAQTFEIPNIQNAQLVYSLYPGDRLQSGQINLLPNGGMILRPATTVETNGAESPHNVQHAYGR